MILGWIRQAPRNSFKGITTSDKLQILPSLSARYLKRCLLQQEAHLHLPPPPNSFLSRDCFARNPAARLPRSSGGVRAALAEPSPPLPRFGRPVGHRNALCQLDMILGCPLLSADLQDESSRAQPSSSRVQREACQPFARGVRWQRWLRELTAKCPQNVPGEGVLSAQAMQREAVRQCQARYLRPPAAHPGLAHRRRGNLTAGETPSAIHPPPLLLCSCLQTRKRAALNGFQSNF